MSWWRNRYVFDLVLYNSLSQIIFAHLRRRAILLKRFLKSILEEILDILDILAI